MTLKKMQKKSERNNDLNKLKELLKSNNNSEKLSKNELTRIIKNHQKSVFPKHLEDEFIWCYKKRELKKSEGRLVAYNDSLNEKERIKGVQTMMFAYYGRSLISAFSDMTHPTYNVYFASYMHNHPDTIPPDLVQTLNKMYPKPSIKIIGSYYQP